MSDLTWDDLVKAGSIEARDLAWAEITRLRDRVDSLETRNTNQGRHMVGLESALSALQQIVRQFVDDADTGARERTLAWYVKRFRELVAR